MKEIIIDGVDVKDCKRRTGKNSYCRYFKRPCADNNFNCIWKQCERLKAENAELKKQIEAQKGLITVGGKQRYEYLQQIEELEQENAELQGKLDAFQMSENEAKEIIAELKAEKEKYYQQTLDDEIQINELLQTLREIKECLKDWEKAYTSFGFCEYENILNKMKDLITKSEVVE